VNLGAGDPQHEERSGKDQQFFGISRTRGGLQIDGDLANGSLPAAY